LALILEFFPSKHKIMAYNSGEGQEGMFPFGRGEEQYHKMVEEVEDYAILLLDSQGIVRNWNKGAEKIKGYTGEEIVGRHFRVFYTKEDQEAGLPEKLVDEAVRKGKAVHEGWRVRKNGTTFWGSIVITALHNEEGGVIGFSKVTRDLTERKVAEDKLVQYSRQLEIQNKELQQFAYAAAHDLKEPLRKVQFYYSAIAEEGVAALSESQRAYLERSAAAAGRMQRLIEDLLAFTKLAEPLNQLELVDLDTMVAEVSAFFHDALEEANGVVVASALPAIQGIPFQVRQLLVNLFGNAIKYRHPLRPLRIAVSGRVVANPGLREADKYLPMRFLKIEVKDNGMGFAVEYAERIFDMFERLHGREAFEGTGIGLAICRKILENHNGYIRAESRPGEGAVFEVFFPV
jgi:PAS domain S-box-containing protein